MKSLMNEVDRLNLIRILANLLKHQNALTISVMETLNVAQLQFEIRVILMHAGTGKSGEQGAIRAILDDASGWKESIDKFDDLELSDLIAEIIIEVATGEYFGDILQLATAIASVNRGFNTV